MSNGSAYPIIYVRGFAGGTSGIDTATDDPFYGFKRRRHACACGR